MVATIVHVYVKPENIQEFIQATKENHLASVKEEGNLRFDVIQDQQDPSKFVLYEAYSSELYANKHKETEHYLTWRETVAPWMSKPREGVKHFVIFPEK